MKKTLCFTITFCAYCCIGCAYNPGPPPGPGKTMPPNAGSIYVYNNTPIDTNGVKLTDSSFTTIDSVAATGMTYNGKTNVTRFSARNLKTGLLTSSYINFESNGDISEYVGGSVLSFIGITYPDWVTYPMQSHTTSGIKIADTTINYPVPSIGTVPIHTIIMDSLVYLNWNTFSFNSSSLPVYNLKHRTNFSGTVAVFVPFNSDAITTISFAPGIGYYTDKTTQPFHFPLGILPATQGSEMTLVNYNLK